MARRRVFKRRRFGSRIRRTYKRYRKFNRFYRKKRGHLRVSRIKIRRPFIADSAFLKFKYNVDEQFTPSGSGGIDWRVIRAGNPSDPDTANSIQPTGYDQWAQFYNRLRVVACKVTFSCTYSTAAVGYGRMYVWPSISSGFPSSWVTQHPEENPMVKSRKFVPLLTLGTERRKGRISYYMTAKKMFPTLATNSQDFGITYAGGAQTDPIYSWHFGCGFMSPAATPSTEFRSITVTYYVQCYDANHFDVS